MCWLVAAHSLCSWYAGPGLDSRTILLTRLLGVADQDGLQQCMLCVLTAAASRRVRSALAGWLLLCVVWSCCCRHLSTCAVSVVRPPAFAQGLQAKVELLRIGGPTCSAPAAHWRLTAQRLCCLAAYPKQLAVLPTLRTCGWLNCTAALRDLLLSSTVVL